MINWNDYAPTSEEIEVFGITYVPVNRFELLRSVLVEQEQRINDLENKLDHLCNEYGITRSEFEQLWMDKG